MHGLTNLKSVLNIRKWRNSYTDVYRGRKRGRCSLMLQQDVYIIITVTAGCEMVKHRAAISLQHAASSM
jgi:hypothetical protein